MDLSHHVDYRLIFNASSNGMAFTRYDSGQIIDVNDVWVESTGFPRELAVGKSALELGTFPVS